MDSRLEQQPVAASEQILLGLVFVGYSWIQNFRKDPLEIDELVVPEESS